MYARTLHSLKKLFGQRVEEGSEGKEGKEKAAHRKKEEMKLQEIITYRREATELMSVSARRPGM